MELGRVGGALVVASAFPLAAALVIATAGGSVSVQGTGPGGLAVTVGLALLAAGLALVAVGGRDVLPNRAARVGFGLIAVGLAATIATSSVAGDSPLVVVFLLGGAVSAAGLLITALALVLTPGRQRRIAAVFLAGIAATGAAGLVTNLVRASDGSSIGVAQVVAGVLALTAGGLLVLGVALVGMLGLERSAVEPTGPR